MKKLLLLLLFPVSLFAQTLTIGSTTTQMNPSQRGSVATFWPDGTMDALSHAGTNYVFAPTTGPGTVQVTLPNLNTWTSGLSIVNPATNIGFGGSGAFDQNYVGGGGFYYDSSTGILIQVYHGEQWFGGSGSPFYAALGLAYSNDFGSHWSKLGEIISPQSARVNGGSNCQAETGVGRLVVVGSFLQVYYTDTQTGCSGGVKMAVARASIASVIAAAQAGTPFTSGAGTLFMKYTGSGTWNGNGVTDLANPAAGGGAFTQIGPAPTTGAGTLFVPDVRFDSFNGKFITCYSGAFQTLECSWSSDGLTGWSSPQVIVSGGSAPPNAIYYPTLLNTAGGDPQTLGQNFSLFYVRPFGTWSSTSLFSVALSLPGGGSTINAASCNSTDVLAALNSVTSSTTLINIPAGVCNWTAAQTWNMPSSNTNLTIQGQTAVNCTGTAGTSSWACTPTDNTVIKDSITTGANSTPLLINVSNTATFLRVSGITWQGGTGVVKNNGFFNVNGQIHSLRVDNTHYNPTTYSTSFSTFSAEVHGDIEGVFDHFVCDQGGSGVTSNCIGAFNAVGDTIGFGDGTWAQPTGFGGSGFLFMESFVVNGGEAQDCADGGKFVLRYGTINNGSNGSAPIHEHGTKTQGGRGRGCRAYEAYNVYNAGPSPNADALVGAAGGTALIYHNTLASGRNWFMAWSTTRNDGSATETNTPNGWGYCGTNINSNGVGSQWDGNTNTGTGYPCMDGVGRGQGQAMNGQNWPNALNSVTGSISQLHQNREPDYVFGNTILNGAAAVRINSGGGADTDGNGLYYDAGTGHTGCTGAFNGTCGTGHGNAASRPATCTAGPGGSFETSPVGSYGVAYYEDDTGLLDICTATNTWGQQFNPSYTYPHPLAGGTPTAATPTFAPGSGTYTPPQSIVVSTTTPAATIHYTTDNTTPTTSSPTYSTPLTFSGNTVLQAIAVASGFLQSPVGSATYTFTTPTCANPTQNPPNFSGTYTMPPVAVSWTSPTAGCSMFMTLDTSAPSCTVGGSVQPYAAQSFSTTTTMRVIACQGGFVSSSIIGGTWTINPAATLTVSAAGTGSGTIGGTNCTPGVSAPTVGSSVACTATGTGGAVATSSGTGSASGCSGATCSFTFSATSTLTYSFAALLPVPVFSPLAGTYSTPQSVTLTDPGAVICYTVDASTPTTNGAGTCVHGTTYSGPISVSVTTQIIAIATKAGGYTDSAIGSATYTINLIFPPKITGNVTLTGNISIQ